LTSTFRSLDPAVFAALGTRSFVEFQRTPTGTAVLTGIDLTPRPYTDWVGEGPGSFVQNSATSVTVSATAAGMSVRRSFATTKGKTYQISFTVSVQDATVSVGNTPAGNQLLASRSAPIGTAVVSFVANSSISHLKISSTASGGMLIGSTTLTETVWAISGPGTVSNTTATTVSITGTGTSPTIARRTLTTIPGERYTVSWTSDSATGTWAIGSAEGLTDIASPGPSFVLGPNAHSFIATTDLTYYEFRRTATGTVNLTVIAAVLDASPIWTGGGGGTATITSETNVTLIPGGSLRTWARRSFETVPNRKYELTAIYATNAGQISFGTTSGGAELVSLRNTVIGTNKYEFVSDTNPTWIELSRVPAGNATITGLVLTELSVHPWYTGGTGTIVITDATQFTLTGVTGSTTFVHRPIPTVAGREYIWGFTVAGGIPNRQVGSGFGGSNLAALAAATTGANSVRFIANNYQAWVRVQISAVSAAITVSNIHYDLVPFENATNWSVVGTGVTSIAPNQTISITGNGTTATSGRRSYNTVIGQAYELLFTVTGIACAYLVGTVDGGAQVVPQATGNPGTVSVKFVASSTVTHLTVQRTGAGTTNVTRPVMSLTTITGTITPTAASHNSENLGGIGKPYYYVDRLSDSATDGTGNRGSLRYCLTNNIGNDRLILSEIQGVLTRTGDLGISADRNNVTLAFFTGPGPIVQQGSWNCGLRGQNNVIEHACIERSYNDRGASNGDGLQIISSGPRNVNHILVRNCFTAHSQDEAMQVYIPRGETAGENQSEISLHWNIFTNALKDPKEYNSAYLSNTNVDAVGQDGDHNFGILVGGYINNIDIQRNIIANCKQRNPRFSAPQSNSLVANNVIINWGYAGIGFQSESDDWQHTGRDPANSMWLRVSIIGNIGIPGPQTGIGDLVTKWGNPGTLGNQSLIHMTGNSIIQGLNAAVIGQATTIGSDTPIPSTFPGLQAARQDTLLAVTALAQAQLISEMDLNAGPFPKLRAKDASLMVGVSNAIAQMKNEIAGKMINHEAEGPGLSKTPTVSRPLTGSLAPPTDSTDVDKVKAWLQERRLEVSYGV
jgi:hypothetical protein